MRQRRDIDYTMMRISFVLAPLAGALAAALAGCGGSGDGGGAILLRNENNYSSTGNLTIPTVETAPATDLDICWTNVVDDFQCHTVAPMTDVETMSLLRLLHLSEDAVEQRLETGELAQSEVDGYLEYRTPKTSTCAKLSQLSFFGTAIKLEEEYVESANQTYLLLFAKGTRPGVGARTMTFIKPTAGSTNTKVDATTGCGLLDFTADLTSLTKVKMPAAAPWVIDWRNLTVNGQGNTFIAEAIDSVLIGYYEGMTVQQIQADIFDLELNATTLWDVELSGGRTADLSTAVERGSGAPFSGFARSSTGVWLLALLCSTCQNPAPVLLTVLEPAAGGG
jgi:hypothetical protein